ncbi:hypothetical protein BGZ58_003137 [Dissophora ornata]|nr:hypothetical protein BGZ58_003137 [Dissophora ornata]
MLDRILAIGSTNSIQRGDMDKLPDEIRDAFGFNLDDEERTSCLRSLLSSAQKCMTIAMDSGLVTGRQQQALVAACLVIAVEVRLALTKPCDELLEFAVITFSSAHKTVSNRYKELKRCMLVWARRLPFVKDASKIKAAKLVYYMDDVFKYFGHLNQQNQQLWTMLDKSESVASGNDEDGNDRLGPGEFMTEKDLELEQELENDGAVWTLYSDDDSEELSNHVKGPEVAQLEQASSVPSVGRLHPPAYEANLRQEKRRLEYLEIAKTADSNSHPSYSRTEQHDFRSLSRINWTRSLLLLGTRTEQELIEATDNTLEYWARSDHAKMSNSHLPRSREELDSAHLTAEDLDEQEFEQYLRTPSETEAVLRVQGHIYAWAKESTKQTSRSPKPKRSRESECGPGSQSFSGLQQLEGSKRVRSSKLNLEALSDNEEQEEQKERKERVDGEEEVCVGGEDVTVETWGDGRGGVDGFQEDVDSYGEQDDFDDYNDGYE